MFCNTTGRYLNPESVSQLFGRIVHRAELPRSGSTTSATPTPRCSSPPASPIKVVTERLGHAHPAFTMHTYQHLLPGMSAAAADAVRRADRRRRPVDVYRLDRDVTQVSDSRTERAGRRRR